MDESVWTGGCLCGAVRYEARGAPKRVGLCHCETCRRNTGSAFFAFAVFSAPQVRRTGELATHRAPTIARRFCPTCGSLVSLEEEADEIDLALGTFDEPHRLMPEYELWVDGRMPWLPSIPGLRRHARNRDEPPLPPAAV